MHQNRFLTLTTIFIITLAMLTLGGLLARALLGDTLFAEGATSNHALPTLFIELFPTWLAALVGVGILAAIMSTADGLVVSSSQIIANDLYRRSIVPRLKHPPTGERLDRQVLYISRVATVAVLIACAAIAWSWVETNVMLIVWIGTGCVMSALAGSLVFGALWRGVTRAGAYAAWSVALSAFWFCTPNSLTRPGLRPACCTALSPGSISRASTRSPARPSPALPQLLYHHCLQSDPAPTRVAPPGGVRERVSL